MPKKMNSAGQLQNYVPAGNGDASGEYGDNASGSNIHYKTEGSEKTGKSTTEKGNDISVSIRQESGRIDYKGKDYTDQKEITNIIREKMGVSKVSENVKRVVAQLNSENIDPTIRNVVLSTLESGNYKIEAKENAAGVFYSWGKVISFSSVDERGRAIGETMFHECGHALDHQYNNGSGLWSRDYKSKEFGKTMLEMKDEELGKALSNGGYEKLVQSFENEAYKYDQQIYQITKEITDTQNAIINLHKLPADLQQKIDDLKAQENKLFRQCIAGEITYEEYWDFTKNYSAKKKEIEAQNPNKAKVKELEEKINQLFNQKEKLRDGGWYTAVMKYSDISDMCEALGYKSFAGGHGRDYWWQASHRATECFAEIQSSMGTNKASLELLQKYIPNTIKIYNEIIGVIHNGNK